MATITDVARKAGVSVATVSYVLNNKPTEKISGEVKERVMDAARSLAYKPNHLARSLILKRTATIGVISDSLANAFFYGILAGVQDKASASGYALLLGASNLSVEAEAKQVEFMLDRRVDGLVLVTVADSDHCAHIEELRRKRIPLVLADERVIGVECDYVISQNSAGAGQATNHLLSLGHRRIAFVGVERWRRASTTLDRLDGYRNALQQAAVAFDPQLEWYLPNGDEEGSLRRLLVEHKDVSALFLTSDSMAPWVFGATRQLGLEIPVQLAVVGFDDSPAASTMPVPLTAVRQPCFEMGIRAVEVLLESIETRREGLRQVQLPTQLIVRRSTIP